MSVACRSTATSLGSLANRQTKVGKKNLPQRGHMLLLDETQTTEQKEKNIKHNTRERKKTIV